MVQATDMRRRRGPRPRYAPRRKVCAFCVNKDSAIDYKDPVKLRSYVSDRGKIEPGGKRAPAPNISGCWRWR